jgi:hypothetical protein
LSGDKPLRVQPETTKPWPAKRAAMAAPMRPRPTTPTRGWDAEEGTVLMIYVLQGEMAADDRRAPQKS